MPRIVERTATYFIGDYEMAMTDVKRLHDAIDAAKQFLKSAEQIQFERVENENGYISPKTTGQCRRDSMDLTRALAELRKPGA